MLEGEVLMVGPFDVASALGITVSCLRDAPVVVGCSGLWVMVRDDGDPRAVEARVWEGIAQCLLAAAAIPWSEDDALVIAAKLKVAITGKDSASV